MITDRGLRSCSASLLPAGTILMTSRATLGEAKISKVQVCTNQGFKSLIANPGVSNEFLYYQIHRTKGEYARFGSGSTFLEVGKKDTAAFPVLIPEKPLQDTIVQILDLIDCQIEATEALIAKQERLRAGLMQDLFTRGVDENGELRPPREEAPHLYHETELGWLPKGWSPTPLFQLIDPSRPISYGILMPGPHVPDGIPVIKVKDIRGGKILELGLRRTSRLIDAEYARSRLRPGDILFTIRGTVGRLATVPETLTGANITQDTARLAMTGCDPSFARYFLESASATRFVAANTLGNAVQGINLGELRKLLIPNFDPSEQRELVNCILRHDALNDQLNSELSSLQLLKNGLMQDLLTGTVSVEPLLEKEPA